MIARLTPTALAVVDLRVADTAGVEELAGGGDDRRLPMPAPLGRGGPSPVGPQGGHGGVGLCIGLRGLGHADMVRACNRELHACTALLLRQRSAWSVDSSSASSTGLSSR